MYGRYAMSGINFANRFISDVFWPVVRTPPSQRDYAAINAALASIEKELAIADKVLATCAYLAGDDFRLHLRLHWSWLEVFYARYHLHSLFFPSAYIIQVCSNCLCGRVMCAKDLLRDRVDIFEYPCALAEVAERGGWVFECEDRRKSGT